MFINIKIIISNILHHLQKKICAEILARVLTDGADATVVAEIHSWIEYFEFLDLMF